MVTKAEQRRTDTGNVSRPRDELERRYRDREARKAERAARGERPRIEEATTMAEALEAEREAGRAEGEREKPTSSPAPSSSSSGPSLGSLPGANAGVPSISAPLVAELVLITVDELATKKRFPIPSRLLVAFAFFGVLGFAKGRAAEPAAAVGWGIVVATFYAAVPGKKPAALSALKAAGDFLGGKYGAPGSSGGKASTKPTSSSSAPHGIGRVA